MFKILFLSVFMLHADMFDSSIINIADFGAIPDDGKDDTAALRAALTACRGKKAVTLFMPEGTYELKDEDAIRLENEVMEGKMGANPEKVIFTPYYSYRKGLDFSGMKNVKISAQNVTLLCDGWMEPVSLENTSNVVINGLTIDYKRKPFSTGEIKNISEKHFDVKFSGDRIITEKTPLLRMLFWNKNQNRLHPQVLSFPKREILKDNIVRFHHTISEDLHSGGVSIVHSYHFRPAILILNSENITLNDVTIHSQPGMGIVGFNSRDIVLNRLSVVPSKGYFMSTNTDATHFASCKGLLRFDACTFKGHGDDATNVHGYYQNIIFAEGNRARIEVKARTYTHVQVADVPDEGDELELVEIKSLQPVKTYTVKSSVHNSPDTYSEVLLSDNLPDNISDYYLMNISRMPRLEFENSSVENHFARGVLIKTRNARINNNVFRNGTGTAIHVGAESYWNEGSHSENIVISNNTISGYGSGAGTKGGAAGIAVLIEADKTEGVILHQNVRIENNHIEGEGNACGMYIGNTKNVVLQANKISKVKNKYLFKSTDNVKFMD